MNQPRQTLESLVRQETYKVRFLVMGTRQAEDGKFNPKLNIYHNGSWEYFGFMVPCRGHSDLDIGNEIRDTFIASRTHAPISWAKVISVPKSGEPRGPYILIGAVEPVSHTAEAPGQPAVQRKREIPPSLVVSDSVFYAECVEEYACREEIQRQIDELVHGAGKRDYDESMHELHLLEEKNRRLGNKDEKSPALVAYNQEGKKIFGFLTVPNPKNVPWGGDRDQVFAESMIAPEIIKAIKKDEYIIVKKCGIHQDLWSDDKPPTYFFSPVINFEEGYQAESPDGITLLTRVIDRGNNDITSKAHYPERSFICDLPIVAVKESRDKELVGIGYVPRPPEEESRPTPLETELKRLTDLFSLFSFGHHEKKRFYYKPVFVKDAAADKGRYIKVAEIVRHTEKIIIAQKVA